MHLKIYLNEPQNEKVFLGELFIYMILMADQVMWSGFETKVLRENIPNVIELRLIFMLIAASILKPERCIVMLK